MDVAYGLRVRQFGDRDQIISIQPFHSVCNIHDSFQGSSQLLSLFNLLESDSGRGKCLATGFQLFGTWYTISGLSNAHKVHSPFLRCTWWHAVCIHSSKPCFSGSGVSHGLHSKLCASSSAVNCSTHFYTGKYFTVWMYTWTVPLVGLSLLFKHCLELKVIKLRKAVVCYKGKMQDCLSPKGRCINDELMAMKNVCQAEKIWTESDH